MVKKCRPKGLQSLIASLPGPSHKSPQTRRSAATCFLAQPTPTHPRASPFDALISVPAQHVLGRTPEGTSRTVLTDQIGLPKVSRSPQRRTFLHHPEASLEHASFRLLYHKTAQSYFSIQRIISANISEDMHASLTLARPTVIPMIRKSPSCQSAWPSTAWPKGPTIPVTQHPKVLPAGSAVPRPPCYPEASQRPCLNLANRPKGLLAI